MTPNPNAMKTSLLFTTSLASIGLFSCTHITMLGHKTAYDVNAEFSGDPIAPVSLNAGFEGRTFAAVPPREAIPWNLNFMPTKLPKGDVMSSILELKIEKMKTQGTGAAVPFDYVTSGATGLAADAAAGADPTSSSASLQENPASGGDNASPAKDISDKIQQITDSGSDVFDQ